MGHTENQKHRERSSPEGGNHLSAGVTKGGLLAILAPTEIGNEKGKAQRKEPSSPENVGGILVKRTAQNNNP